MQLGIAPIYLIDLGRFVSGISSGRNLRSAGSGGPLSPVARTTLMQIRAFCVNDTSVWNGLPLELRPGASISFETMKHPPYFRKDFILQETFSASYTFPCDFSPKMSFRQPKFLTTFFSNRL